MVKKVSSVLASRYTYIRALVAGLRSSTQASALLLAGAGQKSRDKRIAYLRQKDLVGVLCWLVCLPGFIIFSPSWHDVVLIVVV